MRKRIYLAILACACLMQVASAQKLHKIIFANTDDRKIGSSVKVDNDRAIEEIDVIAGYIGYEVVDYVYNSNRCTKQNLLSVLNGLSCSPQDIVFFYYSGHGVHPNGAMQDKFPQMCMNTNIESLFVPVRQVEEILSRKAPRLRIIITDCCNDINSAVTVKSIMDGSRGATIMKGSVADNYRRLFVNAHGRVMATSSKIGQTSGCAMNQDGSDAGGIYSCIFWDVLLKYCEETNAPTWNAVIGTTRSEVAKFTHQEQMPDDALDVTGEGGSGSGVVPPAPAPTPNPANATTSNLSQALAQLLSMPSVDARLAYTKTILQNCFRGNGIVVTVGRNLKTVVDYETADKFLRRIAMNQNIVRINVIKEETDGSGKPYITVHEMRKGY